MFFGERYVVQRHGSHVFLSLFGLCLALLLLPNAVAQNNPMNKEDVKRGAAQYQQLCASCHGPSAKGGLGPSLIDSSLVRHDKDGDLVGKLIQDGRPDKGMPAFPALSASQISDLVAYLHARIEVSTIATAASGPVGGYVLKRLLTGNAEAGKQYFYGEGQCARCHCPTKDLAGIGSKYSAVELESRFLFPPEDKPTATVSPPSGTKIKGKFIHVDEFYVAIIDDGGWAR